MSDKMKNIPKLRFPEFLNELEWKEKKIKNIFSIFQGYAFSSNDSVTDGVRWLKIADVDIQQMNCRTPSFLPHEFVNKYNKFLVKKGDYVIALTRPILNNKLKIAKIDATYDGALLNQRVGKILTKENSHFVYFLLQKSDLISEIENSISGSEPPNLSAQQIENIIVHIPLIDEQQKIADCLSSLDSIISAQSQKIELLKEHKKGLLQNLFPRDGENIPKFRFPEFVNDGEWENKKVGDIFQITRGYVLSMNFVVEIQTNKKNYPVYSSQTKNNGLAGYYSEYLYENAITWTTDGANAGDVNYREGKFYCTNVCGVLLNEEGYANLCIAEIINSVSKNYVSYVGNPKLMNGVMSKIEIRIPSLKEQQKIAIFLTSMDREINLEIQKVEALKEHKKALLQQLFPSNDKANT